MRRREGERPLEVRERPRRVHPRREEQDPGERRVEPREEPVGAALLDRLVEGDGVLRVAVDAAGEAFAHGGEEPVLPAPGGPRDRRPEVERSRVRDVLRRDCRAEGVGRERVERRAAAEPRSEHVLRALRLRGRAVELPVALRRGRARVVAREVERAHEAPARREIVRGGGDGVAVGAHGLGDRLGQGVAVLVAPFVAPRVRRLAARERAQRRGGPRRGGGGRSEERGGERGGQRQGDDARCATASHGPRPSAPPRRPGGARRRAPDRAWRRGRARRRCRRRSGCSAR